MLVVQDPDAHAALLGFIEDDIHIVPPARAAEVLVRSGLHADSTDTAIVNGLHFPAHDLFGFSAHPEERENMIIVH